MITNADVTLYHQMYDTATKKTTYKKTVIQDVSWYASFGIAAGNAGMVGKEIFKIRIPPEALVDGTSALDSYGSDWVVGNKDYFCRGEGPDIEKPSDLEKINVRYAQVCSWSDNRRGGLPHIRIEGW